MKRYIYTKTNIYGSSLSEELKKGDVVVVNIESKLNNPVRFVPVVVENLISSPVSGRIFEVRGWAWRERQHPYSVSSIVYFAKDYRDAEKWIYENSGVTVREFKELQSVG